MGSKARQGLTIFLLTTILLSQSVCAAEPTAAELYDFYGIPYSVVYPEGVLETINYYLYAQKYEHMYKYVLTSHFDDTIIPDRIHAAEERLNEIISCMQGGYFLSREEIYSLEQEYNTTVKYIDAERSKLDTYSVDYRAPTTANVPSYEEYIEACNTRAEVESHADIGRFVTPMEAPVSSTWLIESTTKNTVTFKVANGTSVSALWNGQVVSVDNDKIVVSCYNEILVGYSGMAYIKVKVGDTVYQGQSIGKAGSTLTLKLKLGDTFVDISRLFIKE